MRQPGRKRLSWGYVLLGFVAITLFIAWALLPELTAPQLARFIAPLGFGIVGIFVVVAIFTVVLLPFLDRLVAPLVERLGPTVAETPPPVSASARTPAARPLTDAERQSLFTAYCEALRDGFGSGEAASRSVDLTGSARQQRRTIREALGVTDVPPELREQDQFARESSYRADDDSPEEPVTDIRACLLGIRRGVLLGEPGSGKSWTIRHLVHDHAVNWLSAHDTTGATRPVLPVLVELQQYSGDQTIEEFVTQQLQIALDVLVFDAKPLAGELLANAPVLLLCDALNEMPKTPPGMPDRELMVELRDYLRGKQFLVACRVRDYDNDLRDLAPLAQVRLHDLDLPQICEAIDKRLGDQAADLGQTLGITSELRRFYAALEAKARFWERDAGVPDTTSRAEKDAWKRMHEIGLLPLCRSPYLLQLICTRFRDYRGELPRNRSVLFATVVERLFRRERKQRGPNWPGDTTLQTAVANLALVLQRRQGTTLPETEALAALLGLHRIPPTNARGPRLREQWRWRRAVLRAVWQRLRRTMRLRAVTSHNLLDAGIGAELLVREGPLVRFRHQLLQEYFVATALRQELTAGRLRAADLWPRDRWWERTNWDEAAVLLAGLYQDDCTPVLTWLAEANPEVAADCLLRGGAARPATLPPTIRARWLARFSGPQADADPRSRAGLGRALGLLDQDTRPGVGVRDGLPDIVWQPIPAGDFPMGEGTDARTGRVERACWMARYPVTVAQYASFVADGGYAAAAGEQPSPYWTAAGWAAKMEDDWDAPAYWLDRTWHIGNHPVVGISWYEAWAFAQWLERQRRAGHFRLPPELNIPDDCVIRLPQEAEWEKAARGTAGLAYPWGAEYQPGAGNINETWGNNGPYSLGRTSAVGSYPLNRSPYCVRDLSGNVWEWCQTRWQADYQYPEELDPEGKAWRALRGGSWYFDADDARAAFRGRYNPVYRFDDVGFRVVVAAPIPGLPPIR